MGHLEFSISPRDTWTGWARYQTIDLLITDEAGEQEIEQDIH